MGCCQAASAPPDEHTNQPKTPPPEDDIGIGPSSISPIVKDAKVEAPAPAPAERRGRGLSEDSEPRAALAPEGGADGDAGPEAADEGNFISEELLGEPVSLTADDLPDWQFELERDQWRSYPAEDSVQIDRYYQVWQTLEGQAGCKAKVRVMKRDGVIDFRTMSCRVGTGRARRLVRKVKQSGWLTNAYFFQAFKNAVSGSDAKIEGSAEEIFDFRFNQDFRSMKPDSTRRLRGGQSYLLPIGWKRFAVNVRGKYPGDMGWLKEDDSGWAVAYHGTSGDSLPGILSSGFRVGGRQKFAKTVGSGIYCTPDIDVAQHYSRPKELDGHFVQIVLQLRVKPSAIKPVTDPKATEFEKKYWIITNPQDVRAYGVLIRELGLSEYIPPEAMVFGWDHPVVKQIMKDLKAGK